MTANRSPKQRRPVPFKTPEIGAFIAACEAFLETADPPLAESSLSSILFSHGRQIERLRQGKDITTGRLRTAWARLEKLKEGGSRRRPGKAVQ